MKINFDTLHSAKPFVGRFFHWADHEYPDLSIKSLKNNKPLYVCDDDYSWASPYLHETSKKPRLYLVKCRVEKPLVLLNQFAEYEVLLQSAAHRKFLKLGKFDSVFYTPHPYSRGVRQAALLKPKQQVLDIAEVLDFDMYCIETQNNGMHKKWNDIMFPSKKGLLGIYIK